jgi:NAD(P)-dependent dehydrogenase (short-subunit alcohol dehydrogenase family)
MEKKVILITGAGSGFGYLTSLKCASQGHRVYASMRDVKSRNANKASRLSQNASIVTIELDVTDDDSVKQAIDAVIKKESKIDVLINNAGVYPVGITETFTDKQLHQFFDVNLYGMWRTTRHVLPQMRKQGDGLIINTSSVAGRFSVPFMTIYNASKFAIEGLTEGLHYEVKPLGIDVVLIQPGAYPTEIFSKIIPGVDAFLAEGYGEVAKIPEQMGMGIQQMFESLKPDPQFVADSVSELIATPKGKRPLRKVIDKATGQIVETANQHVQEQYNNFLTAFGMQGLL